MIYAYATDLGASRGLRIFFPLRSQYPLIGKDSAATWVDVAKVGEWHGHRSGPFRFDLEIFKQCVDNLEAQANPVPLYFGHEDVDAIEQGGEEPEAKGWVHKLAIRGDRLWAFTEFSDRAAAGVKRGGWKFSSGFFDFDTTDRVTGKPIGCQLVSLALVGRPFIDGQHPIQLSQRAAKRSLASPAGIASIASARTKYTRASLAAGASMSAAKVTKADLAELVKRIQGDDVTLEQVEAILCGIAAERGETIGEASEEEAPEAPEPPMTDPTADPAMAAPALADPPAAPAALTDAPAGPSAPLAAPAGAPPALAPDAAVADPAVMVATKLMELTGLDAAAILSALEQNADAIKAVFVGGAASQAPVPSQAPALSDEIKTLKLTAATRDKLLTDVTAENIVLRARVAVIDKKDAEAAVDGLIADGRILDDARAEMLDLALSDRPRFDKIAAKLKPVVPMAPHALSVTPAADPHASATVDEADPFVRQLRHNLGSAGIVGKKQDDLVRAGVANKRNTNGAPAPS
jgi:hypothetical protein